MHRKRLELICKNPDELLNIAESLLFFAEDSKVWTFTGELGAGKTTLIKEICNKNKVTDSMSSPSFSIVNVGTSAVVYEQRGVATQRWE